MAFTQYIYALSDPMQPSAVRYVGRTNTPDLRLRMHTANAAYEGTVKAIWLMYLAYAGRTPLQSILEESEHATAEAASAWGRARERHCINEHAPVGLILNGEKYWQPPQRRAIPKAIRTAWCEAHSLLFAINRAWIDESRLLKYLAQRYGSIMQETKTAKGTRVECVAEHDLAESQFKVRRWQAMKVVRALESAHPGMAFDFDPLSEVDASRLSHIYGPHWWPSGG